MLEPTSDHRTRTLMQISASANRLQTVRVEVASLPESGPGAFTLSLNFTGARTAYNLPPTHSWLLDIFPPVRPLHGRTKQRRIRATQRNNGGLEQHRGISTPPPSKTMYVGRE